MPKVINKAFDIGDEVETTPEVYRSRGFARGSVVDAYQDVYSTSNERMWVYCVRNDPIYRLLSSGRHAVNVSTEEHWWECHLRPVFSKMSADEYEDILEAQEAYERIK